MSLLLSLLDLPHTKALQIKQLRLPNLWLLAIVGQVKPYLTCV
jgi:hypothetical protein